MPYLSGPTLCRLMRRHHITIRLLAQRLAISMKRVRRCRQCGIEDRHVARDRVAAIMGQDPSRLDSAAGALMATRMRDFQVGTAALYRSLRQTDPLPAPRTLESVCGKFSSRCAVVCAYTPLTSLCFPRVRSQSDLRSLP
jgi:hypothetical protein